MTQYQLTLDPTVPQHRFTSRDGQLAHWLEAILNQVLGQERLNEEIRPRERVIRLFPNRQPAMRLPCACHALAMRS